MNRNLKNIFLLLLALALFVEGGSAFADVKSGTTTATRDIVLAEDDDAAEQPVGSTPDGLGVEEMHKNDFVTTLTSDRSDGVYNIGDKMVLSFKSEADAYVTILDFTPSGQIVMLFPNKWVSDNFVKAGTEIKIPAEGQKFSMKAGGPVGVDVIKAIATNNEVQVFDEANKDVAGPFSVIKEPKAATRDILLAAEDDESVSADSSAAPLKWSVASLALMTKDNDDKPTGFASLSQGDTLVKTWVNGSSFLVGERVFFKLLANKGGKLISLTNAGASNNQNKLLPEDANVTFAPGEILILPRKDDKWKLVAAESLGKDTIEAKVELSDGTQLSLVFDVMVETD
ncbi:MAG: DUF4384 domain-containing protein [Synergistaceae bacterium]|jgi:hypothetical protein|nr:DUF4384 domain-containing protein [Synergistaceae bacterium]